MRGAAEDAASSFFATGRAGCVGRLARPGESVLRRLRGGTDLRVDEDAAFFGTWLEDFLVAFFATFLAAFSGALLGRFLVAAFVAFFDAGAVDLVADFLVVLLVFFEGFLAFVALFLAFAGGFVDVRFAVGLFVVFFVAIGTPERSTLSESQIVATVGGTQPSTTKTNSMRSGRAGAFSAAGITPTSWYPTDSRTPIIRVSRVGTRAYKY